MANVYPRTEIPSDENVKTFWENICSLPRDNNPSIDNNGERDQPFNTLVKDPDIFYLSSQREGTGQRKVKVPEGMKIFISVLGVVATTFESQNSTVPQPDLRALAQLDQDSIRQLSVEFNGQEVPLADLNNYKVPTNEFDVVFPDYPQAVFPGYGAPRESKAVADGRYLIIEPLSKGKELIIHIKGNILVDPGKRFLERGFNEDLTYTLIG
jgi:hypothetical protein